MAAIDNVARGMAEDSIQKISSFSSITTVSAVTNTYTINLSLGKNFSITTSDAVAKTIVFSNVPSTANTVTEVSIYLNYANAAAITYPAGVVWQNGITPSLTANKKYWLLFTSVDNGVSWMASIVGAW